MLTFETKKDVLAFLASIPYLSPMSDGVSFYPNGTYYLSHGEYSQPEYKPRKYKDGWGIHGTCFYFSGTFFAPRDGRVDEERFLSAYCI